MKESLNNFNESEYPKIYKKSNEFTFDYPESSEMSKNEVYEKYDFTAAEGLKNFIRTDQERKLHGKKFNVLHQTPAGMSKEGLSEQEILRLYINNANRLKKSFEQNQTEAVFYLDKSARPVRHLMKELYTDQTLPRANFINIDRIDILNAHAEDLGINKLSNGRGRESSNEEIVKAMDAYMFRPDLIEQDAKKVRALFLDSDQYKLLDNNLNNVFDLKSKFDDKNIMAVDEVSATGSTLKIAETILNKAFKNSEVKTETFWKTHVDKQSVNGIGKEKMTAPIWYVNGGNNEQEVLINRRGRGVTDPNQNLMNKKYEQNPNIYNQVRKLGAIFISSPPENGVDKAYLKLIQDFKTLSEADLLKRIPVGQGINVNQKDITKFTEEVKNIVRDYSDKPEEVDINTQTINKGVMNVKTDSYFGGKIK